MASRSLSASPDQSQPIMIPPGPILDKSWDPSGWVGAPHSDVSARIHETLCGRSPGNLRGGFAQGEQRFESHLR